MIDTFQIYCRPRLKDVKEIKKHFKPSKIEETFVWILKPAAGISMKYIYDINLLQLVVTPAVVLNKQQIVDDDYAGIVEAINRNLSFYFGRLRFSEFKLSRIDYKLDITTPYKDIYIEILKQLSFSYRRKYRQEYMTSVYYKGKSYVFNLYDKEAKEGCSKYKDMLRLELQLKSAFLRRQLHEQGLESSLQNYFSDSMRRYMFEDLLAPLLYKGDYYTVRKSRYVLVKYGYTDKMIDKLLEFQKLVLAHGMSAATMKSGKSANTVRGYLVKLQEAGVNPIPLPNNCRVNHLPNLLSFFNKTD